MDAFNLIQDFFATLTCYQCQQHFEPDGIRLVRQDGGMFLVSVYCHRCEQQMGMAVVGMGNVEMNNLEMGHLDLGNLDPMSAELEMLPELYIGRRFQDPELTDEELERLSQFSPITEDDVLSAHHFFQNLDDGWTKHIPEHLKQPSAS